MDAWREFYGFDREGQEGWFNVNVDTEKLTLEFAGADSLPEMRHHGTGRQKYVTKPEEVLPVAASMETADDFYGPYYGDCRVPGPFAKLEEGKVYELDPRKYRK